MQSAVGPLVPRRPWRARMPTGVTHPPPCLRRPAARRRGVAWRPPRRRRLPRRRLPAAPPRSRCSSPR
eukprot:4971467-Pleurochrysis_carterae.AAC.1